jgi:hypothetical protein
MSRSFAACVLLTVLGPAVAAPKLKDMPGDSYFPTTVGDRWVIEMRYKTRTEEYTEVVTAVEKKDGATVVSVGREVDGTVGVQVSDVHVSEKGLFRGSLAGHVYDAPYCILKFPLKPGQAWASEPASGGTVSATFKYKAIQDEDVEVPAGKFRAFRIEVDIDSGGRHSRSVIWYGARVGIVKMEHDSGDASYTRLLKSFRPGKK